MPRPTNIALVSAALTLAAGLAGCSQRRVMITSEPSGALVSVNDRELGRTPIEADFVYYGVYDVRVEAPGFEPLRTKAKANTPIYEYPPVDFAVSALPVDTTIRWHFKLQPALETTMPREQFEDELLQRARVLRGDAEPASQPRLAPTDPGD